MFVDGLIISEKCYIQGCSRALILHDQVKPMPANSSKVLTLPADRELRAVPVVLPVFLARFLDFRDSVFLHITPNCQSNAGKQGDYREAKRRPL